MVVDRYVSGGIDLDSGGQQPAHSDIPAKTVADTSFETSSSDLTVTPTPEPTSAALLAFGGAALLGWRRRRVTRHG